MKVEIGQIIDQYADFPGKDLYLMARYIVLAHHPPSNDMPGHLELYTLKGYIWEAEDDSYPSGSALVMQTPGDIELINSYCIVSREETINNFYWEIVDGI